MMPLTPCLYCQQPLRFERGRGWVHPQGGLYLMSCPQCGWRGAPYPSPTACPRCGSRGVRDHHVARPDFSRAEGGSDGR